MKKALLTILLVALVVISTNSYSDDLQTTYAKALSLFNNQKYLEAYKLLDKVIVQNENSPLQFYIKAFDALNEAFLNGQIDEKSLAKETKKYDELLDKREINEIRVLESFLYVLANTRNVEKIEEICKKIILTDDKNITASFFLMKILIQKEKFNLAYNIGIRIIEGTPVDEMNYQLISEVKYLSLISKLYSKNLKDIEEILSYLKEDETPHIAYILINTYYTMMMFEKVKEVIDEVGIIDPEVAAKTYIALNDKTSLRKVLNEYSEEIPNEVKSLANEFLNDNISEVKKQINSQNFKGDPTAMKLKLEISTKEKNKKEMNQALREISYFLFAQGRYKDAIPYLEKIKNQDDLSYYLLGSCYMEQKEYNKALKAFSKIKKDFKIDARIREAFSMISLGNYAKAREIVKQTMKEIISKGNDTQKILVSQILIELGDTKSATKVLSSCNNKDNSEYNITLATIYFLEKDYSNAEKILKSILENDEYNIYAMNALAYLWATKNENLEEALKLVSLSLFFEPEDYTLLDTAAFIHYKMGNYQKAKELIAKSVENMEKEGRSSYEIYLHASEIYETSGEKDKSVKMLNKAQEAYKKIYQR